MTGNEIRRKYIDYFKKHNHKEIKGMSLVPNNDPTLLFTNAGMVQFKNIFLGKENINFERVTSFQKCLRAGGKHNDLKNVGYTARHHTFFEMLGNFSFGSYFKQKAIEFAWDVMTNVYELSSNKLWISVHDKDDESYNLWEKVIGVSRERIVCFGDKENFWSMGKTGPCGPCSEIYIDRGKNFRCNNKKCDINCDCGRFVELWNLVFMQFNRDKNGHMDFLPKKCIDTGMGLERIASIIQNVKSNFETDLILPIINKLEMLSEISFGNNDSTDIAMKVIADHSRAVTFLIGDGVFPSNEGRGYVLKRIIRRAIRYGKKLKLEKPFFYTTVQTVLKIMDQTYPELKKMGKYISFIIKNEEIKFSKTLDIGLKIINNTIEEIKNKGNNKISGKIIFKLYDTYGFPIDDIKEIAKDKNMHFDLKEFNFYMTQQRKKSHFSYFSDNTKNCDKLFFNDIKSYFIGYDTLNVITKISLILVNGVRTTEVNNENEIEIAVDITPFYGRSGGQLGDSGSIETRDLKIIISNTVKNKSGINLHKGKIVFGKVYIGQIVSLKVNKQVRNDTSRNHTATHILHAVLRSELGNHVRQSGSMVSNNKLRFDFSYFSKISEEMLKKIENEVNKKILDNIKVKISIKSKKYIKKLDFIAFFEEKYKEEVRTVEIGNSSKELCGGTHVSLTGDIGMFIILSEYGIASGIRRIEALTGNSSLIHMSKIRKIVYASNLLLKSDNNNIVNKIIDIQKKNKVLNKENEKLIINNITLKISHNFDKIENVLINKNINKDINIITKKIEVNNISELRKIVDRLKNQIKYGIIALGAEKRGKAILVIGITKNLTHKFDANKIAKKIALVIGGNGGGRPDMAQAGGNNPNSINKAMKELKNMIKNI